ncbi:transglutaminase-like domain-containing protein [Tsukamurella soli]|uniref:Transglutaminase family protein n=1 Tax=Tsukamurella soli TaxID=644556 RepID=A0ABP8J601_9ACTN
MLGPRKVSAEVEVAVLEESVLEFQISLARMRGVEIDESLLFTIDGEPVEPLEVVGEHGGRVHRFTAPAGQVRATYRATVDGVPTPAPLDEFHRSLYLRPSRYAEADMFYGFAGKQFGHLGDPNRMLMEIVAFVANRLDYIPGSSDPIDGAADTLLAAAGVCRDYAHLVIALLRAVKIPARLAAVYAPGCDPMDFHAVAEALIGDTWHVVDATGLAPRQSMLRISTGRDSSDTAFLDNHGGAIRLDSMEVTAIVDGDLPIDQPRDSVVLG